jgi:hypothetical protein
MQTVTILSGTSLSGAVSLPEGFIFTGVQMPSAWTTANLTFQFSIDGATYTDAYDEVGTEITVVAAASRFIRIPELGAVRYVKIRSGTTGTPVNQGGNRTINLSVSNI